MTWYAFSVLALSFSMVWDMLSDRAAFASRFTERKEMAISLASILWVYSVDASGVTPGLALLLKAPAIVALAYTTWTVAWSIWKSWWASRHA